MPMRARRNGRRAAAVATDLALAYTVPSSAAASSEEAQGDDDAASVVVNARREACAPPLHRTLDAKGFLSPRGPLALL
jgi:hypothetical protein